MGDNEKRFEVFKQVNNEFSPQEITALLVGALFAIYPNEQAVFGFLEDQRKVYDALDKIKGV